MGDDAREGIAAVVLNYRRVDDTLECIRSLMASEGVSLEIIVVDNCSRDGSAERIASAFPKLRILCTAANLGYAGGNNLGIRAALRDGARAILVINNDCTVERHTVARMVEAAASGGAGIVSPKVCDYFRPDTIQYAGYRNLHFLAQGIPVGEGERDKGQYDRPRELNAAPGCAMLLSRRLCEMVGLFDEQFFSYSEELDLCRRATEEGFRIVFAPLARVWHKKAATLDEGSPDYAYYLTRGRLIYARKHLGWCAFAAIFLPYFIAVKLVKGTLLFALTGRWRHIAAMYRAVGWNMRNSVKKH